jgi:uncharacterized protein (DUF1499 family)
LKTWKSRLLGTALALAALLGAVFAFGSEYIWSLFGPADLGPVSWETLVRRASPNDALACPAGFCGAASDVTPPEFLVSAHDLRLAFGKAVAGEPRLSLVASDDATLSDRYVQRSRLMGFPDTIMVHFVDRAGGRSTIALYSRSQVGRGDMGVNLARIERWLRALEGQIRPATSS